MNAMSFSLILTESSLDVAIGICFSKRKRKPKLIEILFICLFR